MALSSDDLVSLIQDRLGFRKDRADYILKEAELAQFELERDVTFNPWFLWRAADVCVKEDCVNLALPTGFLRLCEFNNPLFQPVGQEGAITLSRGFADDIYAKELSVGCPSAFSLQAKNLRLNRKANGMLRLFYITYNAPLGTSVKANLWTEHAFHLLMYKTGMAVAATLQNDPALKRFTSDYMMALDKFKAACVAYEDYQHELTRMPSPHSIYNQVPVGVWLNPGTTEPCTCGG